MGFKSLSWQMIQWCFHFMGSACRSDDHCLQSPSTPPAAAVVRLIGADGKMRVYDRPVPAAELMKEHPRHLVCRSDAFFIGQKVPPLVVGDHLQPGQSYFLLPSQFFHSVLSFITLAASLLGPPPSSNNVDNSNSAGGVKKWPTRVRPFDIHKTASGKIQIRVSDEFLLQKVREEEEEEEEEEEGQRSRVVTTEALEKDYKMLVRQRAARHWRPMLETIRESSAERRISVGSFDRKRKKAREMYDYEEGR